MNFIPYVLEQSNGSERGYDIYSRLLKDRIILLTGEINEKTRCFMYNGRLRYS